MRSPRRRALTRRRRRSSAASTPATRRARRPACAPRLAAWDERALASPEHARRAPCAPWLPPPPRRGGGGGGGSFGKTSWPERLDAIAVHREATKRFEGGRA